MPETLFRIRWPDGAADTCYSPSTIIKDHLAAGRSYPVPEFVARCRDGLQAASGRVRALYGTGCSRAMAQLRVIEATAARHADDALVRCDGFDAP